MTMVIIGGGIMTMVASGIERRNDDRAGQIGAEGGQQEKLTPGFHPGMSRQVGA
jgi:hypothetical protein